MCTSVCVVCVCVCFVYLDLVVKAFGSFVHKTTAVAAALKEATKHEIKH